MRRPKKVIIAHTPWKIVYDPELLDAGLCWHTSHEIHVCSSMPEQGIRSALLHELLHAVAWTYGFHPDMDDLEESVVSLFSVPVLTLLQENATLRQYLLPS